VLSDEVRPPQWIERSPAILWTASFQDELWAHAVKEQNDRSGGQIRGSHSTVRQPLFEKPASLVIIFVFLLGPNGVSSTMGLS
jgi:hypothetical protein